jgi:glycosyltransferase involved in cell wall biosynthesis
MLANMKIKATAHTTDHPEPPVECVDDKCKVEVSPEVTKEIEDKVSDKFLESSKGEAEVVVTDTIKRDSWPDQKGDDPKVTLAMIVKNEESCIADCLSSMQEHVDQIVIVDTGSTDRTVEIAESYGAKVYHHPWEDSFSKARNQVISYVETPWLIQLDADEIMEPESACKVRDVVRANHKLTTNLVHLVLLNKAKGSAEETSFINTGKIMRVVPSLYFTSRVHNKLHCPGDSTLTNLRIIHHGYSLDDETMDKKRERTTRLLLIQASETPEDFETHHYLAIQYLRMEDWDNCIRIGKQAVELAKKYEPHTQLQLLTRHTIAMAYYYQASKLTTRGEQTPLFNEAIKWSKESLELYPDYLDANNLLGAIYFAIKDHKQCWKYSEKYLQVCIMLKNDPSKGLVIPLMSLKAEWMVCLQMAINSFEQADADTAIKFVAKAEDLLPNELKYKVSWGIFKYMITLGDPISLKNAEAIYMTGFKSE